MYNCIDRCIGIENSDGKNTEHTGIFEYLQRAESFRPDSAPPCPFVGGYVGWFGYELRHDCGSPTERAANTPDAMLIYADRFIAVDHLMNKSYIVAIDKHTNARRAEEWLDDCYEKVQLASSQLQPSPSSRSARASIEFHLDRDEPTYLADINRCLELIKQGETYQVCLTNEISCLSDVDPLDLYRTLRIVNPAPYAAFLRWPGGAVLSASPERFLSVDCDGTVETKPIKGTIRRDKDPVRDCALSEQLRMSEKDRAENVMIVDLLRNDLSRTCEVGTVAVPNLFEIESYQTVHQLVSTVQGRLGVEQNTIELLRNAFPGGSMTGAPKPRTLEFIDELEGRPRGVYSGALGWIGDDGAADLSIVIRTIVATGGRLTIGVGGGIVAASQPEAEFEEMLLKAQALIESIVVASTGEFDQSYYRIVGASGLRESETKADRSGQAA